ncbi:hypothetical protein C8R45DRAFT_937609 [Mycena sanguinolenta]|nr:hypothetical protein C8R45DRAFT_937609 [Mycena sanguinolenta]
MSVSFWPGSYNKMGHDSSQIVLVFQHLNKHVGEECFRVLNGDQTSRLIAVYGFLGLVARLCTILGYCAPRHANLRGNIGSFRVEHQISRVYAESVRYSNACRASCFGIFNNSIEWMLNKTVNRVKGRAGRGRYKEPQIAAQVESEGGRASEIILDASK